jgi:endoglucanase
MKLVTACQILGLLAGFNAVAAENPIRLNTVGFLPGMSKAASVAVAATNFSVIRVADGQTVFSGAMTGTHTNADTGEALLTADFSALNEEGIFRLDVPGVGRTPPFRIAADVYQPAYVLAQRALYLWRCGTAVSFTSEG